MVASSNSRRASESGLGAKSSGLWTSPGALGVERRDLPDRRLRALQRRLRPLAVGHVLEEAQDAVEVVGAWVVERVDARPHQLRGGLDPRVLDAAGEQRPEDLARADEGEVLLRLPPRRVRPALDVRRDERPRRPRRARWPGAGRRRRWRGRRPRRRPGRGSAAPARWRRAGCAACARRARARCRSRRRRCGRRRPRRGRARRRRRGRAARSGGGRGRGRWPRGSGGLRRDQASAKQTARRRRRLERNGHGPVGLLEACTASSPPRHWPACGCG